MRSISLRFGVDAAKAELDGPRELGVRLTHSGEDDLPGERTRPAAPLDLAARIGIGGGPEAAQQPGDTRSSSLSAHSGECMLPAERLVHFAVAGHYHVGAYA